MNNILNYNLIKEWYNSRYSSKGQDSMRPYNAYDIYLRLLNVKKGKTILDISCGTGFLLKKAHEKGLITYGIDISDKAVDISRTVTPSSIISVGKGEELHFENSFFDYITCLGSLEHFIDIKKGITEMIRVAKDDALFCISVPNINCVLWIPLGRKGTEQQEINEQLFSLNQWKKVLCENGLKINKIYSDDWFLNKHFKGILYSITKFIWLIIPLKYKYQFVFICTKTR